MNKAQSINELHETFIFAEE